MTVNMKVNRMAENSTKNECFLRFYSGIQIKLYAFILAIVHNQNDAEDLLQETSVVLWNKFDDFEEGKNFSAWAIGIAKNKILEYLRENKRTKMVFTDGFYRNISDMAGDSTDDVQDRINAVEKCLKKLSNADRKLLSMRYKKNVPINQISKLMGRPSGGVYKTFSRIILVLRNCVTQSLVQLEVEI